MKTQLYYEENFQKTTLWVTNKEFKNAGSFIAENESGKTYTASLNDSIISTKFRTLEGAKKAMQKYANALPRYNETLTE